MSKEVAIIVSISLLVFLAILFFVSFALYVKTPPPKGCENLGRKADCESCSETGCRFYQKAFDMAAEKRQNEDNKNNEKGDSK